MGDRALGSAEALSSAAVELAAGAAPFVEGGWCSAVWSAASASKAIGNLELQAKFEKGSDLLKRDIVFCSSLYL